MEWSRQRAEWRRLTMYRGCLTPTSQQASTSSRNPPPGRHRSALARSRRQLRGRQALRVQLDEAARLFLSTATDGREVRCELRERDRRAWLHLPREPVDAADRGLRPPLIA